MSIPSAATATTEAAKTTPLAEDDKGSTLEVYVEPVLKENILYTTDESISLNYQEFVNMLQLMGSEGRFARKDLTKCMGSTEKKNYLMIFTGGWLQVLHSLFVSDDWVYASTICSGVENYWMRIPVKSILNPMEGFDFNLWQRMRSPVAERKLPIFQGLTSKSVSFIDFLDKNKLMEVLVDLAKKSTSPASSTLISGSCITFLSSMWDSRKMTRFFSWHYTMYYKRCDNSGVPQVWAKRLITSFIS